MKPAHLVLIAAALLLGLGLWTGRKTSSVAYKDPLDTNEFPLRFTDPIKLPSAPTTPTAPPAAPKPPSRPALRESWQAAAIDDGMRWMVTEGFKGYSSAPLRSVVYYHSHEFPSNYVPRVPGFEFAPASPPHPRMGPSEVDFYMHMNGAWREEAPVSNMWSQGFGGPRVASFNLVLGGRVGFGSVDLSTMFGVFKTTNGYVTKMLHSFAP